MSFDKDYPLRKDWRQPYKGSKRFDRACRPHGSCSYCKSNRTHKHLKYNKEDINDYAEEN